MIIEKLAFLIRWALKPRGGEGGPFEESTVGTEDALKYLQMTTNSTLNILDPLSLQVFPYRITEISHWFQASRFWAQPIEEARWLYWPMAVDLAEIAQRLDPCAGFPARLWRGVQSTLSAKPNRRHWRLRLAGWSVTWVAGPLNLPPTQRGYSSVRALCCCEAESVWRPAAAEIVKSKSSPNSRHIVWARIACDWHGGEGGSRGLSSELHTLWWRVLGNGRGRHFYREAGEPQSTSVGPKRAWFGYHPDPPGLRPLTAPIMYPSPTRVAL